jgi:hypothetical protein
LGDVPLPAKLACKSGHVDRLDRPRPSFYDGAMTAGDIYTIAGNGTAGFAGDDLGWAGAEFNGPLAVATDSSGDVFVADSSNNRIRELMP